MTGKGSAHCRAAVLKTLADLISVGGRVRLRCQNCGYQCSVDPSQIGRLPYATISDIGLTMRCPDCYRREIISHP